LAFATIYCFTCLLEPQQAAVPFAHSVPYRMKRLFRRGLLVTLSLFPWWRPACAQAVPDPDSADYYFQRGAGFMEDRRMPQDLRAAGRRRAMVNYSRAIACDSSYYWAYRNRGYCHQNFGEDELALADYTRAVRAGRRRGDPDAAYVRYNCLELCLKLQHWADAEGHCSALLADAHTCPDPVRTSCSRVWRDRAEARVHLKKYRDAQQDYRRYQQQVGQDLAEERQKLAVLARAQQDAPRLTNRERRQNRRAERQWDRSRRADAGGLPPQQELTPLEKLEEEAREVALRLVQLEPFVQP
jgi:tetratricopeptide (TPR) repeat protein